LLLSHSRQQADQLWLFDFDGRKEITVGEMAETIDMLGRAFYLNDPYYPQSLPISSFGEPCRSATLSVAHNQGRKRWHLAYEAKPFAQMKDEIVAFLQRLAEDEVIKKRGKIWRARHTMTPCNFNPAGQTKVTQTAN